MDTKNELEQFNALPKNLRIASLRRFYEGFDEDVQVDAVDADTQQYSVRAKRSLNHVERFLLAFSTLGPAVAGLIVFIWLVPTSFQSGLVIMAILAVTFAIGGLIWWRVRTVKLWLTNTSADSEVIEVREPDRTKLMSISLGSVVALLLLSIYAGTVAFMSAVIVPCLLQGPYQNPANAGAISYISSNCNNYVMAPAVDAGANPSQGAIAASATPYLLKPEMRENLKTIFNIQSIVYGLVSALVVATLAATRPGEIPSVTGQQLTGNAQRVSQIISSLYVAIWMACGTAALFVGVFQYPSIDQVHLSSALSTLGLTWVGLAVAASYAYFGINREGSSRN